MAKDKSPAERRPELRETARNLPETRKESPKQRRERWAREDAEDASGSLARITEDAKKKEELARQAKENADDILRKQNPPR